MNSETHASRFSTGSRAASVVLTATLMASSFTGLGGTLVSTTTTVNAANSYGLASKIEDGNILHCFNWKISDITAELPNIAKAGFTSVQTSPIQPHDASGTWYWLYQPTGFSVGNDIGTAEDLKTLCSEADKYGIKVIVDVVANHVAGWADGRRKDYIQNGLNQDEYFHNTEFNTDANNVDWGNRWQVTHCNIGMPDLNSEHQYVQQVVANLVNDLKACGVDGIRWDAAKHIGLPSEDCNFWPAVTAAGLYNYGEILDGPINEGGDDKMVEYTKYIGVTDDNYCGEITGAIRDGKVTTNSGKWANRGVSTSKLVYWPESHDTYCNNGWTNGLSENVMDRAYAVLGARANVQTLYLSRPFEKNHTSIMYGVKGSTHFTSAEVAAVNHFHNAMVGTKEYFTTGDNCFVVCRGGGAVIVNAGGGSKTVTVPNGGGLVPAGTYTDEITGSTWTVTSSTISGNIGSTGIAVFYNGGPVVGGSVSASPSSGTSFTDTLSVTLSASDATNTTYTTSEGASGSFTSGQKITVGASTAVGGKVTVTVKGTGSDGSALSETYTYTKKDPNASVNIYFDNSGYNWSSVYAYVYDESSGTAKSMAAWPGVKMTDKNSDGYFKLDVSGYESGQVIFNDGTGSATNRYPADMQPGLKIGGSSKLFSAGNKWADYTETVTPTPTPTKDPTVTVDKATGTSFSTETFDITLSLSNATSGTYSVDNGPEKTFTSTTKVTIGEGKIGDSDITVKATATDGSSTKSYTFTYTKKYVVKTTSSSASALTGKYATNPNNQYGGSGVTITSPSDFKESMIIAQGVANDDPRIFRGSHEAPVYDTYALYAAWDDTNLYLGWQFTNVTDVVDPAQGYPISDNGKPWNGDIPQMLAFNLGKGASADMSKGNMAGGAYVWGLKVGFETNIDALMCFSSKPGVGQPALFKTDSTGYFNYDVVTSFKEGGISFKYEDGFFGSSITGVNANGYSGYTPADLTSTSSNWVNFLTTGHDKAQDTFYYMTIPLATLGITRSYLESTGIGVMHISTFGEGGIASLPMDMTFLDNATEPYSQDESTSAEKEDTDLVTVPLARIGAGGDNPNPNPDPDPTPTPDKTPLQVNFGADRSAPQLSTTALTLKGIGYGGTAPYKYEFSVDGKVIQASGTTASVSWTPTTAGQHTIKCVITDSTGATATSSKTFTSEGGGSIIIVDDLVNNSTLSATTITLGNSITAKGAATGGTAPYQYQVVYKKTSATSWTTAKAYNSTATATITPAAATTYDVCIKVKDSAGTEVKKFFTVTVNPNTTELKNNSTLSATTITLGSTVTAKGAASGGTSPYKYQVVYKKTSATSWTTALAYGTTTSVSFKPAAATTYDVCIKVKDNSGTEVKKFFTLTVKASALVNNSTVSATSIALGNTVTVKGAATGGTGSYTYAVYYKKTTDSAWTEKQGFKSTSTVSVKPAKVATYSICVKVKDSAGTIEKKYFTVTVKAALVNNSTLSATSIKLGNTITAKGSATGGTGYYNFAVLYKRTSQSTWTTAQAYKSNTTVTFKPAAATTYDVCVKVKDSAGTETKKFFTVKVTSATLTNTSTLSATSISLGSSITAKGSATGGTGSYQYQIVYKRTSQTTWTTAKAYSSTATATIKPAAATTYDVCIKVKDSAGTEVKKFFTVKVTANALTNNSTLSATSVKLGSSITAKGSATGGTGSYQYQIVYKRTSQTTWTTAKAYSSTATATIKPAAATTYDVCIKVKDSAGTEVKKFFTVKVTANAALSNTSTLSATSVTLGNTVTAKGSATGGTSPYTYAYYYKQTSQTSWTEAKGFSSTTSVAIKPAKATTYDVCVKVKDNAGTIEKKYFTVKVTSSAALANTSTLSATSITKGSSVTVKCSATGGTSPYTYAVYYKQTSQSTWTEKQNFSSVSTVSIKPAAATTYQVCVKVKDSSGTIEKKYINLTVK